MSAPHPALAAQMDLRALAEEPLCEELRRYVVETPLGPWVKHPLVFSSALLPGHLNRMLEQKRSYLNEKLKAREWAAALWMYERPHRLPMLAEWRARMTREQFRDVLPDAWQDAEEPHQHGALPLRLFRAAGFLTDAPTAWKKLPAKFTIYRGASRKPTAGGGGISWTINRAKGEWFARRFTKPRHCKLWVAEIRKRDALAYFNGRGEDEVVIAPASLINLRTEAL